jgi:hypothetical protein
VMARCFCLGSMPGPHQDAVPAWHAAILCLLRQQHTRAGGSGCAASGPVTAHLQGLPWSTLLGPCGWQICWACAVTRGSCHAVQLPLVRHIVQPPQYAATVCYLLFPSTPQPAITAGGIGFHTPTAVTTCHHNRLTDKGHVTYSKSSCQVTFWAA